MPDRWVDEPVPCRDPECPEEQPSAQPEADGTLRYYACPCGYEFPAEIVSQDAGACQLGVPEEIRRLNMNITGRSIDIPVPELTEEGKRVFLGPIGRRPG